ncbi:hypothetical protein [Microbacterium istanbulense]|uniref:Uncharacterized protein n=1 Tax=Microbacterium istanbulense TaxID=3122049 RepID=A0ABU8LME9_9MICO
MSIQIPAEFANQNPNSKALYRPGGDAQHVAHLLQALINSYADGQPVTKAVINGLAKGLPSEPLRTKFFRAAERLVAKQADTAQTKIEAAK